MHLVCHVYDAFIHLTVCIHHMTLIKCMTFLKVKSFLSELELSIKVCICRSSICTICHKVFRSKSAACSTCLDGHREAGRAGAALTERRHSEVVSLSTVQYWKLACGVCGVAALHFPSRPPDGGRHVQFDIRPLLPGQLSGTRAALQVDGYPPGRTRTCQEEL